MKKTLLILLGVILISPINSLIAQETSSVDSYGLEEIIVTAQKRDDSIQTVPIAITAISGDILDKRAVVNQKFAGFSARCTNWTICKYTTWCSF
jgi:iron complex outermembrane receptor protein